MSSVFRSNIFSLEQAAGAAPHLALLTERIRISQNYLSEIQHLIPAPLRRHIKAGPLDEGTWCLLVSNAAVSTKVRQLLPVLLRLLTQNGAQVTAIRIKVQVKPP
ncbi:hypothetical protein LPB72_15185 [Hydrogenophaga crassostreae]|uniref:DUF721 domain-containing protein n=1 Tax=Hydrogenophaga crassostreae TaxID=1763535 RepID=A0A167HI99_9BURK|nr:DciA family protein [Hydrogenophaga crassostreae]AOW12293.1 hypothetical protein LPB072_04935 [Hydrogenophaga crassostreae]OAD41243.1 hypothetical protein LPB72_15185 [Hydrogenophaga crassostreae]